MKSVGWRRLLGGVLGIAALYCASIELWLPRNDPLPTQIQAVVVLNTGVLRDGSLDRNGTTRLRRGVEIVNATRAPLFLTRVQRSHAPILTSDSAQKRVLVSAGLLTSPTIAEGISVNTRDEAERISRATPIRRIVLVTSRLHTRRACWAFERMGFVVTCVSAGAELPLWKAPYFVVYESAALLKYRLNNWI